MRNCPPEREGEQVEEREKVLQIHSAANLFPLLEGPEFESLVRDIRTHGLCEPVVCWRTRS